MIHSLQIIKVKKQAGDPTAANNAEFGQADTAKEDVQRKEKNALYVRGQITSLSHRPVAKQNTT